MPDTGTIKNFITKDQLGLLSRLFLNLDEVHTHHSVLKSINPSHQGYPVLEKIIMPCLTRSFGDAIKIGAFHHTRAHGSYGLHFDSYQVMGFGEPYLSILLPLTNSREYTTFVFDLEADPADPREFREKIEAMPVKKNMVDKRLDHVDPDLLSRLDLLGQHTWEPLSAIYWKNTLLHCSSRQPDHETHKEFFIIHTFR